MIKFKACRFRNSSDALNPIDAFVVANFMDAMKKVRVVKRGELMHSLIYSLQAYSLTKTIARINRDQSN